MTVRMPAMAWELERRFRFERLVLSVSTHFINLGAQRIDSGVEQALQQVGEFCAVDRAYVFLFAGGVMSNTHEWCARGVEPQRTNLQELPLVVFPWWVARIERQEVIHIPAVIDLPDEASAERGILLEQDIVSVVVVPMVFDGKSIGFIGFDSIHKGKVWDEDDITLLRITGEIVVNALERKRADEERRALEEQLILARSLDNVARLAGGVAHDFNNLLSVILNHARALERELSEPRLRDYARVLTQSAEQAAELTRQLMIVGRRELLQAEVLDINQIITSLENLLRRTLGEAVAFELSLSEEPCWVKLGKAHLKQVIVNLIMNAHDALPNGGHVRISTRREDAQPKASEAGSAGGWVHLCVSDDGVGMSEEVVRRAPEPFFSTKGTSGTGLGLSTVHGIVRQAGGRVVIESRPNQGTSVEVYLPRVAEPAARTPAAGQPVALVRGRGERILLVEDSEPLRLLVERTLHEHGYIVWAAADATRALELLSGARQVPDLLLTDVILPGLSGRALAQRARERHAELRVAYMSGYDDEVLVRQGLPDPSIMLLPKPFRESELLEFVRLALAGRASALGGSVGAGG